MSSFVQVMALDQCLEQMNILPASLQLGRDAVKPDLLVQNGASSERRIGQGSDYIRDGHRSLIEKNRFKFVLYFAADTKQYKASRRVLLEQAVGDNLYRLIGMRAH